MTTPELADWQQRVVDEKAALDEKIGKLAAFMDGEAYKVLHWMKRNLLVEQLSHMRAYADVLRECIQDFGK